MIGAAVLMNGVIAAPGAQALAAHLPTLAFAETTPHAVRDPHAQREVETRLAHWAHRAHGLRVVRGLAA